MAHSRLCSIPDCGKAVLARGWCGTHYQRWNRYGDPDFVLKPPKAPRGEPLRYFETVVLSYDGDDCLTWPYMRDEHGRARLFVNGKPKIVSRLVCARENGPPPTPKHQAAHSCGKGHEGCVSRKHLTWKTKAQNEADKIKHGTLRMGESHYAARLTDDGVRRIKAMKGTMSQQKIADIFGVSRATIQLLHAGKTWCHVT